MKQSLALILKQNDTVKKALENKVNASRLTEAETVFYQLAKFFQNPKQKSFDLNRLNLLQRESLELALESINVYFHFDTYLIPHENHTYTIDDLLNQADFAKALTDEGLNFNQSKLAVYYQRGKLPSPTTISTFID